MSDFFDYLTDLALDTAPSLAPRSGARFYPTPAIEVTPDIDVIDEPVDPTPGTDVLSPEELVSQADVHHHHQPRDALSEPGDTQAVDTASIPAPTEPVDLTEPATLSFERPVMDDRTSAAAEPGQQAPPKPVPPESPSPSNESSTRSRKGALPQPSIRTDTAPTLPQAAPGPTPQPGQQLDEAFTQLAAIGVTADNAFEYDLDVSPRFAPLQPLARVEAGAPAGTTRAAGRHTPSTPSTIQVTIGRVEVRAIQPPAPDAPSPPAAPPPALTLDDYLAARERGSS